MTHGTVKTKCLSICIQDLISPVWMKWILRYLQTSVLISLTDSTENCHVLSQSCRQIIWLWAILILYSPMVTIGTTCCYNKKLCILLTLSWRCWQTCKFGIWAEDSATKPPNNRAIAPEICDMLLAEVSWQHLLITIVYCIQAGVRYYLPETNSGNKSRWKKACRKTE